MFKKSLASTLVILIIVASFSGINFVNAQPETPSAATAQKFRERVTKLGVGEKARVEVKLRDAKKLKGYINAASEDSFTVTNAKTGAAQTVAYADVAQVKKPGGGLSTRTWVIIGAAAVAAIIIGVTVVKPVVCDGGAGC